MSYLVAASMCFCKASGRASSFSLAVIDLVPSFVSSYNRGQFLLIILFLIVHGEIPTPLFSIVPIHTSFPTSLNFFHALYD
jgi:hypothetical protein